MSKQEVETRGLAKKLLVVQREINKAVRSSSNPHFRSKYADLNEVLDVAKSTLNPLGLSIAQSPGKDEFGQFVETSLIDSDDAQQVSCKVYFSGSEDNMQKVGAAITYARRFGLKSLLAMEEDDDDGESAVGRGNERKIETKTVTSEAISKPPVEKKVQGSFNRKTTLDTIKATGKVLLGRKIVTVEELATILESYGVKTRDELTDEQAKDFLGKLQEKNK